MRRSMRVIHVMAFTVQITQVLAIPNCEGQLVALFILLVHTIPSTRCRYTKLKWSRFIRVSTKCLKILMLNYDIHLQIIHLTGNYFIVRSQVAVHKNGSHSQHYVNSQNPLLCELYTLPFYHK